MNKKIDIRLTGLSTIDLLVKCGRTYRKLFCQLYNCFIFSTKEKNDIVSFISSLLLSGAPLTVNFTVVSKIVNSVYRSIVLSVNSNVSNIRIIHIPLEVFKRFPQTLNSSSAVVFINRNLDIVASLFHQHKNSVKSCTKANPVHPVFQFSFRGLFTPETSATRRFATTHIYHKSIYAFAAVTKKFPNLIVLVISANKFLSSQSAELFIFFHKLKFAKCFRHLANPNPCLKQGVMKLV